MLVSPLVASTGPPERRRGRKWSPGLSPVGENGAHTVKDTNRKLGPLPEPAECRAAARAAVLCTLLTASPQWITAGG